MTQILQVLIHGEVAEALWHKSQAGEWMCLNAWNAIKWMEGMKDPGLVKQELKRRKLTWHWNNPK